MLIHDQTGIPRNRQHNQATQATLQTETSSKSLKKDRDCSVFSHKQSDYIIPLFLKHSIFIVEKIVGCCYNVNLGRLW